MIGEKAVEGPLAAPAPDPVLERQDPTLIAVGTTPIRLSDAMAQAEASPVLRGDILEPSVLFETGLVDEAADQVALAKRAEDMGLDASLEVRAQLALARRRILSGALLDLAVSREVSEDRIAEAYQELVEAAESDHRLVLRRIQVSSAAEAADIREKIAGGVSFSDMARRRSLDTTTSKDGGIMEPVRFSELPAPIAAAVVDLGVGNVSAPVKAEQGWYLLAVETRSAVRLPPLEDMQEKLLASLRDQVVAQTVADARAAVPIRLAGLSLTPGAQGPGRQVVAAAPAAVSW